MHTKYRKIHVKTCQSDISKHTHLSKTIRDRVKRQEKKAQEEQDCVNNVFQTNFVQIKRGYVRWCEENIPKTKTKKRKQNPSES